jgi:hypothetical protein
VYWRDARDHAEVVEGRARAFESRPRDAAIVEYRDKLIALPEVQEESRRGTAWQIVRQTARQSRLTARFLPRGRA